MKNNNLADVLNDVIPLYLAVTMTHGKLCDKFVSLTSETELFERLNKIPQLVKLLKKTYY